MSFLLSLSPDMEDDDYVLLQKWAYNAAQRAAIPANEPAFNDPDHTLLYKIADSHYQEADA